MSARRHVRASTAAAPLSEPAPEVARLTEALVEQTCEDLLELLIQDEEMAELLAATEAARRAAVAPRDPARRAGGAPRHRF